jgi:Uma2 family endonuclease
VSTARQLRFSYDDYLRSLERSDLKLEYCAGVIYAMAGGTPTHAELAAAVISLLRPALRGRCSVYTPDARIRVEASDFAAFPDVTVVCGERTLGPGDRVVLAQPEVAFSVDELYSGITLEPR